MPEHGSKMRLWSHAPDSTAYAIDTFNKPLIIILLVVCLCPAENIQFLKDLDGAPVSRSVGISYDFA